MRHVRKDNIIVFFLFTLIIRILLDYLFINYVTDKWYYYGFILDINMVKVLISYCTLFLFIILLNSYREEIISHFFVIILFFTVYVPIGVIYSYMNKSSVFFTIATFSFLILCISTIFFNIKSANINLNAQNDMKIRLSKPIYYGIHFITIITVALMTIQNIKNMDIMQVLNLKSVYSVRENVTYNWGMNYFFSWQTKVLTPFMIVVAYKNKNKLLQSIYLFSQLWLYLLTGQKMVLFTLIIVLLLLKLSNKLIKPSFLFIRGITVLLIFSILEVVINKNSYIIDFFIRRVMYLPALLNFYYYEFFSVNNFQLWKHSFFGRFLGLKTDFEVEPSFVIGSYFFGNENTNAVTGFLGSEYMNGGSLGVIFATIILITIFKIVDKYTVKFGKEIVLVTMIAPLYSLWNSALMTSLVTGGILLALLLFTQVKLLPSNFIEITNNRK